MLGGRIAAMLEQKWEKKKKKKKKRAGTISRGSILAVAVYLVEIPFFFFFLSKLGVLARGVGSQARANLGEPLTG